MNAVCSGCGPCVNDTQHPQTRTGFLALVDPQSEILTDAGFELWWRANHTNDELPVLGGWLTVRMLIGSIDGNQWPWTGITLDTSTTSRWAQVLGTPQKLTLEIGSADEFWRVGHAHRLHGSPIEMPTECQWWVTWIWANQTFTADEAYRIARHYLLTGLVDPGLWTTELLHETKHRK